MKYYSSKEICNFFKIIEKKYDVNSIKCNDIQIWPLVRILLFNDFISTNNYKDKYEKRKKFIFIFKFLINFILNLFKKKFKKNLKSIFFTRSIYLQKVLENRYFDRVIDPIYSIDYIFNSSEKICLDKNDHNNFCIYPSKILMVRNLFYKRSIIIKNEKILFQILKEFNIPFTLFEKSLKDYLLRFFNFKNYYYNIFKHCKNLNYVFIAGYGSTETLGIIHAARELNIFSVDIQHGKQGRFNPVYGFWTRIPDKGYSMLPNEFWSWGEESVNNIKNNNNNFFHKACLFGYPWLDYYSKNFLKNNKKKNKFKNNILFTLQPPFGSHQNPIPQFIIDYLNSEYANDTFFIFKTHPNQFDWKKYLYEKLSSIKYKNFIIIYENLPVYDLMINSTHHITAFSSCCYESLYFNIPSILFGNESMLIYKKEIQDKTFYWADESLEEFRNIIIKSNDAQIFNSNYIKSSLEFSNKFLKNYFGQ